MAMHIAFTWMESDYRQPDIQRIGGLFSILVAPTLHVIFVAVVLILSSSSSISAIGHLSNLFQQIGQNGFVGWKAFVYHGSEFIFSKATAVAPGSAASAASGIRFGSGSAIVPAFGPVRVGVWVLAVRTLPE